MRTLLVSALALLLSSTAVTAQEPYKNPNLAPAQRAADLVRRLSLKEKIALMQNQSPAIDRLDIPAFPWWNEALHGVGRNGLATVYPVTIGMAASFDDKLLQQCFTDVSDEARAKNTEARRSGKLRQYAGLSFWTPNINIFRDPRWGRGQETYGEDPYLTSVMGLAVVRGLQGPVHARYAKTLACAKHFAVHSGPEWSRHSFDIESLPARDLWETYLPAFKTLVEEGQVAEVMCAYHSMDGKPCCGNSRYLQQILRDEWHFKGLVTSDCGAINDFFSPHGHHYTSTAYEASAKAVLAGTDVECGNSFSSLYEAVEKGEISESRLDTSLCRLLEARFRLGDFDADSLVAWTQIPMRVVASEEHHAHALQMALESMTLLQNNNAILPLSKDARIAVVGPNAADSVILWGNYNGFPTSTTSILKGIAGKAHQVTYIPGCGYTRNESMNSRFDRLITSDGQKGLRATFWNNEQMQGKPAATAIYHEPIRLSNGGNTVFAPGVSLEGFSARLEGTFSPTRTEQLTISLSNDDLARVIIGNDTVINSWRSRERVSETTKDYLFEAGKTYRVQVDYVQRTAMAILAFDIAKKETASPAQIVSRAADADVVIFVGGISPRLEGEEMKVSEPGFKGGDRTSIELPQAQRDMIAALKQAGKRIVLVNCSGSAVALTPETKNCEAILQAWYGGEAGGQAVADVLFGDYNPAGKLPVTFYKHDADLPDFEDYRMHNRTYRYFKGEALFPFGYGLSYTTFAYSQLRYADGKVSVNVRNTGTRDGEEVVEVYVRRVADADGPIKSLRGFKRIALKAGESRTVRIDFPRERFEGWDPSTNTMRVVPGRYQLMVGGSSRNEDLIKTYLNIK